MYYNAVCSLTISFRDNSSSESNEGGFWPFCPYLKSDESEETYLLFRNLESYNSNLQHLDGKYCTKYDKMVDHEN